MPTLEDLVNSVAGPVAPAPAAPSAQTPAPTQEPAAPSNLGDLVNSIAGQPQDATPPANDGSGIDYDAIHAQRDANNAEWLAKRNQLNLQGAASPEEKAQQFVDDQRADRTKELARDNATGQAAAAQWGVNHTPITDNGSTLAQDAGVGVRHALASVEGTIAQAPAFVLSHANPLAQFFASDINNSDFAKSGKEFSKDLQKQMGSEDAGINAEDTAKKGAAGAWVHRRIRGVVNSAVTAAVSGPAAIPVMAAEAANAADNDADEAGLTGWKKTAYVGVNTAVAAFMGHVVGKVFGGNPDASVPGSAVTDFIKSYVQEVPSFFGMNIASKVANNLKDGKDAVSLNDIGEAAAGAGFDSALFHGASGGQKAMERFVDSPSRSNAREAGIALPTDQNTREAIAADLKTQLSNSPETPDSSKGTDTTKGVGSTDALPNTFVTPEELSLERYKQGENYKKAIGKLKEAGFDDASASKAADTFAEANVKDRQPDATFGYEMARDDRADIRDAYIDKAKDFVKTSGQGAHLLSGDFANIGGLNKAKKGEEPANAVLKEMATVALDKIKAIPGAEVRPMRTGGDEVDYVVAGASNEQIEQAKLDARKAVMDVAAKHGVDNIPHKSGEKSSDPRYNGVGMIFGSSEIQPGMSTEDIIRTAKLDRIENQLKGLRHGLETASSERGIGAPERVASGAAVGGSEAGAPATGPETQNAQALRAGQSQPVQPEQGRVAEGEQPAQPAPAERAPATPAESVDRRAELSSLSHKELREKIADLRRNYPQLDLPKMASKSAMIDALVEHGDVVSLGAQIGGAHPGHIAEIVTAAKAIPKFFKDIFSGQSYPETTPLSQPVADAMHGHAASPVAAGHIAEALKSKVFMGDKTLPEDLGAVIKNNRLLGEIDRFGAQGKMAEANMVADNTDVGPGKRWATEADFQKYIKTPRIAEAIKRYQDTVAPFMNEQYRTTAGLKDSDPVPFHGRYFEAPVNLLSNAHAEEALGRTPGPGSNLQNLRKNYNPNRAKASGAAEGGYTNNLSDMIDNTVTTNYAKATRLRLYEAMQKQGLGVVLEKGQQAPTEIKGQSVAVENISVPDPEGRGMVEKQIAMPENIRQEFRMATSTDLRAKMNPIGKLVNMFQMSSGVDAVAHLKNAFSAVDTAISGSKLKDVTVRGAPLLRQIDTLGRIAKAAFDVKSGNATEDLAQLAKVNALRNTGEATGVGKVVTEFDQSARVALKRLYDGAVKAGSLKGSDSNLRDFVNKAMGDYNHRSNSLSQGFLKDYGIAPFMTAGATMGRQSAKSVTGSYGGAEATSAGEGAKLRAVQLTRNFAIPGLIAAAGTMMMTGKPARPGIPFGAVDTGKDDEKGKPIYVDLLPALVRRGLGITGMGAVADGLARGQDKGLMVDSAARDIVNHTLHIGAGPVVTAGIEATTGKRLGVGIPPMPAADRSKGETQTGKNVLMALKDLNPAIGGIVLGAKDALSGSSRPAGDRAKEFAGESASGVTDYAKTLLGVKSARPPMTPAAELANAIYQHRVGDKTYTDDEQAAHDAKAQVLRDVRSGMAKSTAVKKAVDTGLVTEKEALAAAKSGAKDSASSLYGRLTAEEAHKILKSGLATGDEQADLQKSYEKHVVNLVKPLASTIPTETAKKEQWKANVNAAIERARKLGLSKDDVRRIYMQNLDVKSETTRQANIDKFNAQLNYRWK